jgi:hypothetical protein
VGCGIEEDPLHSFSEWKGSVSTCVFGNGRGAGCACVVVEDPRARLESGRDGGGGGSPEKTPRACFRNGRDV